MNYVFILGFYRSGTTLLNLLLANDNENLSKFKESFFFFSIVDKKDTYNIDSNNFKKFINKLDQVRCFGLERHELINIALKSSNSYKKYFENICEYLIRGRKDIKYFIEKTPQHCLVVSRIIRMFPEAKFIRIIRDPRGVINSLNKKSFIPAPNNIYCNLIYLMDMYNYTEKEIKNIKNNYYECKYETLVSDPNGEMANIVSFLGIKKNKNIDYSYIKCLNDLEENIKHNEISLHKRLKEKISSRFNEEYKIQMSKLDIDMVEFLLKKYMKIHNYQVIGNGGLSFLNIVRTLVFIIPLIIFSKCINLFQFFLYGYMRPVSNLSHYFSLRRIFKIFIFKK
jgi:hypothetical protein